MHRALAVNCRAFPSSPRLPALRRWPSGWLLSAQLQFPRTPWRHRGNSLWPLRCSPPLSQWSREPRIPRRTNIGALDVGNAAEVLAGLRVENLPGLMEPEHSGLEAN